MSVLATNAYPDSNSPNVTVRTSALRCLSRADDAPFVVRPASGRMEAAMRRMFITAAVALGVLWINVAAAESPVSKVWTTGDSTYVLGYEFNDVWSPMETRLTVYTVVDESNRFQYTQVDLNRTGIGAGPNYSYSNKIMLCKIYDRGALKVSEAGADLVATTLDPTSPDCESYGYRVDCDEFWNCTYANSPFSHAWVVEMHLVRPAVTRSATSSVQEVNYSPFRRTHQVCKTFEGQGLSGYFSAGAFFFEDLAESTISRTICQATQQESP